MEYHEAIRIYTQGLVDIAAVLHVHHEARTEFESGFLSRAVQDGFLQAAFDADRDRIVSRTVPDESFLIWNGPALEKKPTWNALAWIFPFQAADDMERAYEAIVRAELARKRWAGLRQFLLTCRFKVQEAPLRIPTNIVKIRVTGAGCAAAMRCLAQSPPNLRYVARTVVERLPATNYFRKRTHIRIVVGEPLEPSVRPLTTQGSLL